MFNNLEKSQLQLDEHFMKMALQQAQKAYDMGEVPIGAILTHNNKIIFKAHNQVELLNDVTAHAELITISSASEFLQAKYLNECTLYVTLEPCSMCAGAIGWSQIKRLVFGAPDLNKGFRNKAPNVLHPKAEIVSNILEIECKQLLLDFFKTKRI